MKHLFITLLIINCLLAPQLSAQEENQSACPEITNKKAIEYLEKGRNKKKYEFK
ncbi:MAG: hypothetical protein ACK5T9_00055 [Bacteroidota bacterium]